MLGNNRMTGKNCGSQNTKITINWRSMHFKPFDLRLKYGREIKNLYEMASGKMKPYGAFTWCLTGWKNRDSSNILWMRKPTNGAGTAGNILI